MSPLVLRLATCSFLLATACEDGASTGGSAEEMASAGASSGGDAHRSASGNDEDGNEEDGSSRGAAPGTGEGGASSDSGSAGSGSGSGSGSAGDGSTGTGGEGSEPSGPTPTCQNDLPACVAAAANAGGGTVVLAAKTYLLTERLDLQSNVNIVGQGSSTKIAWDPSVAATIDAPLLFTSSADNIELRDFYLECSIDQDPESEDLRNDQIGLYYYCSGDPSLDEATGCNNLRIERIEVAYCSHGVHLKGLTTATAIDLNLHHNGNTEVDFFHNVYFRRVGELVVRQTSPTAGGYYASPRGHGIRGSHLKDVYFENLSVYDNADHGVHVDNVYDLRMHGMDVRGNCANSSGACAAIKCYGDESTCELDTDAPAEP